MTNTARASSPDVELHRVLRRRHPADGRVESREVFATIEVVVAEDAARGDLGAELGELSGKTVGPRDRSQHSDPCAAQAFE
jgi:hypothetical protein